jgi:hypothetical protein
MYMVPLLTDRYPPRDQISHTDLDASEIPILHPSGFKLSFREVEMEEGDGIGCDDEEAEAYVITPPVDGWEERKKSALRQKKEKRRPRERESSDKHIPNRIHQTPRLHTSDQRSQKYMERQIPRIRTPHPCQPTEILHIHPPRYPSRSNTQTLTCTAEPKLTRKSKRRRKPVEVVMISPLSSYAEDRGEDVPCRFSDETAVAVAPGDVGTPLSEVVEEGAHFGGYPGYE